MPPLGSLKTGFRPDMFSDLHKHGLFGFLSKTIELSSAQLLALNATPITVIPAPGQNRIVLVDHAVAQHIPGTAEYVVGAPTGAVTNRIVTSVNVTNTTFAIANQPAFPSRITCTITDTTPSITAGVLTVTGRDPFGYKVVEVFDVATLANLTAASIAFRGTKVFSQIDSVVSTGFTVLGGAGDETIIVGVEPLTGFDLALKYTDGNGAQIASFAPIPLFRGPRPFANNSIVAVANLTNTSLSVRTGLPPSAFPYQVVVTLVDTTPSVTAGTITIAGTAPDGSAQSEDITYVSGTLVYVSTKSYATVTSVVTKGFTVLGGAGDETIKVGHLAGSVPSFTESLYPYSFQAAVNKAVVLNVNQGELTTGTGTVKVRVFYRIVPANVLT